MTRICLGDLRDFLDYREGSGGSVEIFDLQVGSDRRKGIGRQLVERLCGGLQPDIRVWAITRATNEIAQIFYERCKFTMACPLRRFYSEDNGVDAIMYIRRAGGPL